MILWFFSLITLTAVTMAAFVRDVRRATLALWVAGLGVGCIYLTLGVEVLAIIQWIVSTLVAISFSFFGVMFGEYGSQSHSSTFLSRGDRKLLLTGLGILIGACFAALIWFGDGQSPSDFLTIPETGNDMVALGKSLTENHLLSLEVLALTLFLALIGGGVVARPEVQKEALK